MAGVYVRARTRQNPILMAFRRGWWQFVNAWERRLGDPRRKAREIPDDEVLAMNHAYRAWRADAKSGSKYAKDWLDQHAAEYEALGFHRPAQEGETKILSGWRYSIDAYDDRGQWSPQGTHFAATRSFKYEVGGWMGMRTGYTHLEHCGHSHESRAEALPCQETYRQLDGEPSLADLGPKT
jgi:hypothetical protein